MSRVGRKPIEIPAGAKVAVSGNLVEVSGPNGTLSLRVSDRLRVVVEGNTLTVERGGASRLERSLHGLTRSLINNMVIGVTEGFEKVLEIQGVGYKAALKGKALELSLGYSRPLIYKLPEGIDVEVPTPTRVVIRGSDKQKVGQVAAEIRALRKPDPYKGKGIRYKDEQIRRKVGKAIK